MSVIANQFAFIGWCQEGTSDKVWGYFLRPTPPENLWGHTIPGRHLGSNCCIFYGRRGKAMRFKGDVVTLDLLGLRDSKLRKGYREISEAKLFEIWPNFIEEAEAKLMWEVLAGKVK